MVAVIGHELIEIKYTRFTCKIHQTLSLFSQLSISAMLHNRRVWWHPASKVQRFHPSCEADELESHTWGNSSSPNPYAVYAYSRCNATNELRLKIKKVIFSFWLYINKHTFYMYQPTPAPNFFFTILLLSNLSSLHYARYFLCVWQTMYVCSEKYIVHPHVSSIYKERVTYLLWWVEWFISLLYLTTYLHVTTHVLY